MIVSSRSKTRKFFMGLEGMSIEIRSLLSLKRLFRL